MSRLSYLWASVALIALGATTLQAAEPQANTRAADRADARVDTSGIIRAADVIGMTVKDKQNKEIGHVEDVVVDLRSGQVRYAALAFGGTLGFGEKLFAVPWQSLNVRNEKGDADDVSHFVAFDIDKERLEKSPGFDSDKWPNFADAKFTSTIDKYYQGDRRQDQPIRRPRETGASDGVVRVSQVKGISVKDKANKELGHVEELVFDLNQGKIRYVALAYGGFLGVGDKLFAVPLSSLNLKSSDDDKYFQTGISVETIKNAEGFDQDNWPNMADPKWSTGIDKHYQTSAEAPPRR